jgi:hypothetical protein
MVHRKMRNKLIKNRPNMLTMIILFVLDIDVKSSYPSTGIWANLDKHTIIRQMCKILGIDVLTTQRAGLDLTAGRVNAIDILDKVCKYPTPQKLMHRLAHRSASSWTGSYRPLLTNTAKRSTATLTVTAMKAVNAFCVNIRRCSTRGNQH